MYFKRPPKPSELQSYIKAGAKIVSNGKGVTVQFDTPTLRTFYLRDVLIHELGHHVDSWNSGFADREKYAEWFVREQGRSLL